MPPEAMTISVVIPTHNRRAGLPELLDALAGQAHTEAIVVVNASSDGSLELLQEIAAKDDRVVPLYVEEPGAALARQTGVEKATGDIVLMLDDDVIAEPDLVAGHLRHHQDEEGLVVMGYCPVAIPAQRRPGEYPLDLFSRAYERACDECEEDPEEVLAGLWGGNVSLRRSDCLAVGLVRSDTPSDYSYHEDLDFGLRCKAAGLRGVFDRRLRAVHQFQRTPESYLRGARDAGSMRAHMHLFNDEVEAIPSNFHERGTPPPGRWLIRWSRRRRLFEPIRRALLGTVAATGHLRLFKVESHAGYVLAKVEQQRAADGSAAR